jgi:hypothetical protein
MVFLHLLFQDEHSGDLHGHARIETFAVAGSAFDERIVIGDAGFLRSARDAIFIRDKSDDRFGAAVGSNPCGRDAGNSLFDFETIVFEDRGDVARRLEFLEAEFAVAENLVNTL